jgi:hypothetical protein
MHGVLEQFSFQNWCDAKQQNAVEKEAVEIEKQTAYQRVAVSYNNALSRVQARYRGKVCRTRHKEVRDAAETVQVVWREQLARKVLERRRWNAVRVLQAHYRERQAKTAAIRIQSTMRRVTSRRQLCRLQKVAKRDAALTLSTVVRGFIARKLLVRLVQSRHNAAVGLQRLLLPRYTYSHTHSCTHSYTHSYTQGATTEIPEAPTIATRGSYWFAGTLQSKARSLEICRGEECVYTGAE